MWASSYAAALGALVLAWAGVSAYVLVTRALYDLRHPSFIGSRGFSRARLAETATPEELAAILQRLPRRTLAGIASDARADRSAAAAAAEILLERSWPRLLRRAARHRHEADKWRRIATLRIFAVAGWAIAWPLLEDALADADEEVVGAAITLLGELDDVRATRLLTASLESGAYRRSRIATQLAARECAPAILPLVDHPDEEVRYWAATLLRPDTPERELALASLAGDPSPTVRAAVAKTFAAAGGEAAAAAALTLLDDPVWFVRAQAARALAAAGHAHVAERLVPLLRDDEWWVRAAAKEAFVALGRAAVPALLPVLRDLDRFARNGAAEVLLDLGVLHEWADDPGKHELLGSALHAGEQQVQQALVA